MKKIILFYMSIILLLGITACNDDVIQWKNGENIDVTIKAEYRDEVLENIDTAFSNLQFRKLYVTSNNGNDPLNLLFVLENDDMEAKKLFKEALENDVRVAYISEKRYIYFDTVDTRYIKCDKTTIQLGEELILDIEGYCDYYTKPFSFCSFLVKPKNNKKVTKREFIGINLKNIEKLENGWYSIELEQDDLFSVITALDKIIRRNKTYEVSLDYRDIFMVIPPIWEISNPEVIEFADETLMNYPKTKIIGKKYGKAILSWDGLELEIEVI